MRELQETQRCRLFEEIAESTWKRIIEAHEVGVDLPEIGITADILVRILQFAKSAIPNFDVYAKKGWNEKMYGSDLDVFVEVGGSKFVWFALQAKVLKKENRFTTLRDTSDHIMQWEKLALLETLTGCKGYYLLYNGLKGYNFLGPDSCSNPFDQSQFGCSLVEPKEIEKLANRKKGRSYIKPTFQDIHPNFAQPWRILVCCNQKKPDRTLYSLKEILDSDPTFTRVGAEFFEKERVDEESINKDSDQVMPIVLDNRINAASREAGWNPGIRMIIRTTTTAIDLKNTPINP